MGIHSGGKTKLTYDDYELFPDDGQRHELIGGTHVVSPAPTTRHQRVSGKLFVELFRRIDETDLGEVYDAPTDVQLSENDVVQPDLLVVLAANAHVITRTRIQGAPDLVVEILSDSTAGRDRILKRELYERAGVPEYWLVDPERNELEQFVLRDDRYTVHGRHTQSVPSETLGVTIDLTRVW